MEMARWIPVRVGFDAPEAYVQWARFDGFVATDPFFEQTAERAMQTPFNATFPKRTPLARLPEDVPGSDTFAPALLVFHMSRCGSTLVSQMLGAVERNVVISESNAIDDVVWARTRLSWLEPAEQARLLRAMAAAVAGPAAGPVVFKLHSVEAAHFPLFARAFPGVPWCFVFRHPIDVLVSQARTRGVDLQPGIHPPGAFGIDPADAFVLPDEEFVARAIDSLCRAALDHAAATASGVFIDYTSLPGAVFDRLVPLLGGDYTVQEREATAAAARRNSKVRDREFREDTEEKRAEATPEIFAAARTFLAATYEAMCARALEG